MIKKIIFIKYVYLIINLYLLLKPLNLLSQVKTDTINNQTIIKMTKAKLGDKIILQKINTNPFKFSVSTDDLISLKNDGVSDSVINLMLQKQSLSENLSDINYSFNSNDESYIFKESGIYFKRENKYIPLDPTIVTSSRGTGLYAIRFKNQIEGMEANYVISKQEFYFNFNPEKKDLNNSNSNVTNNTQDNYMQQLMSQMMLNNNNAKAVSPNEFILIKLIVNKNKREYVSGKINAIGRTDFSIEDKYIVNFKYEKVSEYTYKVTIPEGLLPGEYCFLYLGNNSSNPYIWYGQNNTKVFDFSIK
jgi:hypothetical protein